MTLITEGISSLYELESLAQMLFGPLTHAAGGWPESGDCILARICPQGTQQLLSVRVRSAGAEKTLCDTVSAQLPEKKRLLCLALLLYRCAVELTGRPLRWGALTGIRPVKLYRGLLAQGMSDAEAAEWMHRRFAVSFEMSALALDILRNQEKVLKKGHPKGFGLYVSIPFCPGRCSYCSFVSHSVERMRHLMPQYVEQLCEELNEIGRLAQRLDLRLQTVYFGGGTPTTLSAQQLERLFAQVAQSFDLTGVLEYTVEAGRPDTIDTERLAAMKHAGIGRICINPQSMNDATLAAIGRRHTAREIRDAFALARSMGFDCINMDLIAGLPGESPADFARSVEEVLSLAPENITVHTLTLKRASALAQDGRAAALFVRTQEVGRMVDEARSALCAADYTPYYLYRQKNSVGALDNTGYAKPGREGVYNIFIMEETQTILAAGAGAVTKLREPNGGKIERIFNFKFPDEYLKNYRELAKRRERVEQFYEDIRYV